MPEDPLFERAQLVGRIDAELVDEHAPRFPAGSESGGLPAGAVEGKRKPAAEPLVEWMVCHEQRDLGQNLCVTA